MKRNHFLILGFIVLIVAGATYFFLSRPKEAGQNSTNQTASSQDAPKKLPVQKYAYPIRHYKANQTKKVFGTFVTPQHSPVSPERFRGYHTGVDIEVSPSDLNKPVPVYSIYVGKVRFRGYVSGYGGVVIIQYNLKGQVVTALYGHLKLASITVKVGQKVTKGQRLGILGKAYSSETDGERKHLHFSIHKGTAIEFRGYVQNRSELSAWINPNSLYK